MTNLSHYQDLRKRLDSKWKEMVIPVQYGFYDPYEGDAENPGLEQGVPAPAILEQGDPLPPIIPGYAYYSDRGEESVNAKGVAVFSVGCQSEKDEVVDEIAVLQRKIMFKDEQNEFLDMAVIRQYDMMEAMEEEIREIKNYIEDPHFKKNVTEEKEELEALAAKLDVCFTNNRNVMINKERHLSWITLRKTCFNCRKELEMKLGRRHITKEMKILIRQGRTRRAMERARKRALLKKKQAEQETCVYEFIKSEEKRLAEEGEGEEERKKKEELAAINEQKRLHREEVFEKRRIALEKVKEEEMKKAKEKEERDEKMRLRREMVYEDQRIAKEKEAEEKIWREKMEQEKLRQREKILRNALASPRLVMRTKFKTNLNAEMKKDTKKK